MSGARGEGGRRTQSERRRASETALIEAALAIAAENGVGSVTFEAIGARAGYSRGLATQHFGSKQGLIRAVIDHLHRVMDEGARPLLDHAGQSGLEALKAYVAAYFQAFRASEAYRSYFVFLAGAVAERSDTLALFAESHERVRETLSSLARRGQADGGLSSRLDPETLALALGSLLFGASMQFLIDPALDLERMEQEARAILDSLAGARE